MRVSLPAPALHITRHAAPFITFLYMAPGGPKHASKISLTAWRQSATIEKFCPNKITIQPGGLMHFHEVTLSVGHETQTIKARSTRGLAVGAATMELHAKDRMWCDGLFRITCFYGFLFPLAYMWHKYAGLLVFFVMFAILESLVYRQQDKKMPIAELWYSWQWYKKWQLEYTRLNTADSLTFS
jgi:hypothetical protein